MSLRLAVAVVLFAAVGGAAQTPPLTCADVVRLHRSGLSSGLLVELIQVSDALEPLSSGQESVLVAAGLPEEVVSAYRARALGPDDERLKELAELAQGGVDAETMVNVVERLQPPLEPSPRDLEFVTRSDLPRPVAFAVMAAAVRSGPVDPRRGDAARPPEPGPEALPPLTFMPMRIMYRTAIGLVAREVIGRVDLDQNVLRFSGYTDSNHNLELNAYTVRQIWLDCSTGPACYELGIQPAHGDMIRLRDDDWRSGGNAKILALFAALRARYPGVEYRTNVGE